MIIRRRHTANFTTISNVLFDDDRLDADEVGVLAYLLSRPHDWEVRRPALARRWRMGREAIKRVIDNLVRTGWCVARRERLANGTFYMIYEIRDEPGATLTDEEVRRALSLVSSEAAPDDSEQLIVASEVRSDHPPVSHHPPTGYPALADPALADPSLAYKKNLPNPDSLKTDSTKLLLPEKRARELITPAAMALAEQLLVIAGHDPAAWPPGWCGAPMRVQAWLSSGWPVEIIVSAVKASVSRRPDVKANSVQFFETAVAEEIARQNRPVPEISNVQAIGARGPAVRPGNAYARISARLSAGREVDRDPPEDR